MRITTSETAGLLGMSPQGVRMLVLRGQLRRYGSVRRALFDLDEVRELYRTRRRVAPQVSGV